MAGTACSTLTSRQDTLRSMYDKGQISQDQYDQQRAKIAEGATTCVPDKLALSQRRGERVEGAAFGVGVGAVFGGVGTMLLLLPILSTRGALLLGVIGGAITATLGGIYGWVKGLS